MNRLTDSVAACSSSRAPSRAWYSTVYDIVQYRDRGEVSVARRKHCFLAKKKGVQLFKTTSFLTYSKWYARYSTASLDPPRLTLSPPLDCIAANVVYTVFRRLA